MTRDTERLLLEAQTAILDEKRVQFHELQTAGRHAEAFQKGMEVLVAVETVLRMSQGVMQSTLDDLRTRNTP